MTNWKLIFCCFHLISVMSAGFGLEVTMSQESLEVARGDDVTLTCNFKPKNQNNPLTIITWSGDADGTAQKVIFGTYYSENNLVDIGPEYEGKASIATELAARKSMLTLKQVSMKESRKIRCYVQIPGDNEGQTSGTTFLLVQVPPSKPICKLVGTAEYGQNISLTCVSEEGSPTPTYKWEGYDVKNVLRPFPPKTTEKDGVLSLFNVSMETSGFYVCLSSNKVGSEKCNFTLSVIPPSMNIASTLGIVGGCIAGVALLIIIIFCCCRKRKQKPEEYEVGTPVVEYLDKPLAVVAEDYKDQRMKNIDEQSEKVNHDDVRDNYDDRMGIRDDLSNRDDDRKGSRDELSYRYDDQRGSRDELRVRYDDRKGSRDDLRDRYDDRKGSRDDLRDRYDDRRGSRDELRERYNERRGSRDELRERNDERRGSRDELRERNDERRGSRDELRERYDERRGSRDELRERYDERRGSRDDLSNRYDDKRERHTVGIIE
ncbi:cell surface A33 antigen [Triplophysa rosa]|uniref:Cell surface A33 antigen n=1 Tax=Triplophysa rosa TaxID=992332 RepID=A0A9W7WU83_TRIRA|nr:cell surface A33 antigen [Triplophysa rosa]KAI7808414.1 putative cell surface A33 antigen [Triplophysa rosa]